MLKAFKYRINPTLKQEELINKHIGCARFIYNLALETKTAAWAGNRVSINCFDLIKQLPELKLQCQWLREVNSQTLQQPIRNLDNSFTRFFKGQTNFPKFKKKSSSGSFAIPQNVLLSGNLLIIPKFKKGIKIILHREVKGCIKQATIKRTPTGKYFVSILCEIKDNPKNKAIIKESTTVGVDLGIKSFLVTSDGIKYNNILAYRKKVNRISFLNRKFSKSKGAKTRLKLAVLHEKAANQRLDFLHKTSTTLINNHDSFAIEDLNIAGMVKNRRLSQSISDVGWGIFTALLKYKAEWHSKNILTIGRFEPSSKTCSVCGAVNNNLSLNDRHWQCKCLVNHDRDINAAINIKNFALKNHLSGGHRRKNRNELPTLVGVMTSEAFI